MMMSLLLLVYSSSPEFKKSNSFGIHRESAVKGSRPPSLGSSTLGHPFAGNPPGEDAETSRIRRESEEKQIMVSRLEKEKENLKQQLAALIPLQSQLADRQKESQVLRLNLGEAQERQGIVFEQEEEIASFSSELLRFQYDQKISGLQKALIARLSLKLGEAEELPPYRSAIEEIQEIQRLKYQIEVQNKGIKELNRALSKFEKREEREGETKGALSASALREESVLTESQDLGVLLAENGALREEIEKLRQEKSGVVITLPHSGRLDGLLAAPRAARLR